MQVEMPDAQARKGETWLRPILGPGGLGLGIPSLRNQQLSLKWGVRHFQTSSL
jgi:hypothetical protein